MRVATLALVIITIGILGCSQASATPTPPPTSTSVSPTATAVPTATAPALPTAPPTVEPLSLLVTEPIGDSIVNVSPIAVTGSTTPDAVVSINGESVEVNIEGAFTAQITLVEGPNVVEVVASNLQGDQESVILALIYLP